MGLATSSLSDDLKRAHEKETLHLWLGIGTALLSVFFLPPLGLIAIYSGWRLMDVMERSWCGALVASVGLYGLFVGVLWVVV